MNTLSAPKILVVDDEQDLVTALCRILDAQGYSTTRASDGAQALRELHTGMVDVSHRFDVLLTDLMMPGLNGIALIRAALDVDKDLVCIVMTGHGTIDTAVAAMQAGALDYILKPFTLRIATPVLARALAVRGLRRDNSALLQQVANRTAELETANRELRCANEELEAFTHSVSHDVRQPLNVMIGFTELLLSEKPGPLNAKQKDFLGDVHDGGRHLLRLSQGLLEFSRLSRQPLKVQVIDMQALVWEILRTLQSAQPPRRVDLQVGSLPDAPADPLLLRQVWVNLLSNAFKFTKNVPNPTIEVTGQMGTSVVTYRIRDNGAGFAMADAGRLFHIFQRLHSEAAFDGTGVGLSLVRRIVERHGGAISAESEAGSGATFQFTLPRNVGPA